MPNIQSIQQFITANQKVLILADQAIVSGGNFVLGLVLVRLLGLDQYGIFALLWMGALFLLSLHQAFITKPMMTLFFKKKVTEKVAYIQSLWIIQIGFGIGFFGLAILIYWVSDLFFSAPNWFQYLLPISVLSILYVLQDFIRKYYFIQKQYIRPFLMDALLYSVLFIGLFGTYYFEIASLFLTLIILIGAYASSCISFSKPFHNYKILESSNKVKLIIKEHYQFSTWLLGTSILQWCSGNFFLIAAASTLGATAVGAVRIGQNIVGLCHLLFLAMENIVPAEAAQQYIEKGMNKMSQYLKQTSLWMGSVVTVVLGVMALSGSFLIEILYGSEYSSYGFVIVGYCINYFIAYWGFPARYFLRTIQFTKPIFIAYCISAAFSMAAAFPMTEHWGIWGLLTGLIISQLLTLFTYMYFIRQKLKTPSLLYQ